MQAFNTKAIVLKNTKYKDADKIYTLFSEDRGRISVIAKGVRKISSKRSGSMDTLNSVELKISPHKSGQNYLSEVKVLDAYPLLKEDYDNMLLGFYLAELVNKTTKEDEHAQSTYILLAETLEKIEKNGERVTSIINKFEIKLMQLLGYQPPKELLVAWQNNMRQKKFSEADRLIKSYIKEIVGEEIKSLELE